MKPQLTLIPILLFTLSLPAFADDVSGARHLLCSVLQSDVCLQDEGCTTVPSEELNIPRFIRLDASTGTMATTAASGQNRETRATVTRSDGQLILQGVEKGRAFSLFIDEASGDATFAAAADRLGVAVFAACTPASDN